MAAMVEQSPLRQAAARAGGINALCRELSVTRQSFYAAERDGGFTPILAIIAARLTGIDPYQLARERDRTTLDLISDYFARR